VTRPGAHFVARRTVKGTTRTISVSGELDLAVTDAFAASLDDALRHAPRSVVVDLRAAEFIDVTAVRALLAAHRQAISRSVRLVIIPAPYHVHRVFVVCGVKRSLPFLSTARRGGDALPATGAHAVRDSRRARGGTPAAGAGLDRRLELRRRAGSARTRAHERDAGSRHV
jgi:anti-sigma B factor antagonist